MGVWHENRNPIKARMFMGEEVRCLWGGFVERQEASEMPDNAKHHASEKSPKGAIERSLVTDGE